jgi:hypothetical protein
MTILRLRSVPGLLPSLILLAVFVAACAPATSTAAPAQPDVLAPSATLPPSESTADTSAPATVAPTEAVAATALPIATSRGPDLHATDPSTVSLESGQLQLVEFFRFT